MLQVLLFRTVWGLRTRSVGEKPSAADTSGIGVQRLRFLNVTFAGLLAGLAGAYLSLEAAGTFERGGEIAGVVHAADGAALAEAGASTARSAPAIRPVRLRIPSSLSVSEANRRERGCPNRGPEVNRR